jgi:putative glutamine amidotransferase
MMLPPVGAAVDAAELVSHIDGLVLTGGRANVEPHHYNGSAFPDDEIVDPGRDAVVLPLVRACIAARVPVFGICRGIQVINVALGGTLFQDLPSEHPSKINHRPDGPRDLRTHRVRIQPGTRVAAALATNAVTVNSSHHQAIKDLAPGLVAVGWTEDGVIEAAESPPGMPWLLAVQWHPEEMHLERQAPDGGLFSALVQEAGGARTGSVSEGGKEDAVAHAIQRTS